MPVLPGLFPAAQQRGLRNIYELCAEHFSGKAGSGLPQKMLSFNKLRVF
jgi:hypothetical protein